MNPREVRYIRGRDLVRTHLGEEGHRELLACQRRIGGDVISYLIRRLLVTVGKKN